MREFMSQTFIYWKILSLYKATFIFHLNLIDVSFGCGIKYDVNVSFYNIFIIFTGFPDRIVHCPLVELLTNRNLKISLINGRWYFDNMMVQMITKMLYDILLAPPHVHTALTVMANKSIWTLLQFPTHVRTEVWGNCVVSYAKMDASVIFQCIICAAWQPV